LIFGSIIGAFYTPFWAAYGFALSVFKDLIINKLSKEISE
jgi:demethoxyubiquinone hydroxylase (CLK1/Coq7/Cat5 family)